MADKMNSEEKNQFDSLRREVKQDIDLAIANFKVWLFATVLSNVLVIGLPALYVFFNTTSVADAALQMSLDSKNRLDGRSNFMTTQEARITDLERHLSDQTGFEPMQNRREIPE